MLKLPHPYAQRLLEHEPLARYTAARLGGPADWLYVARESSAELATVVRAGWAAGLPVRVLGGGANVLVSDQGFRGLVVINDVATVEFGDDSRVTASSGAGLASLGRRCQMRGLSGLEWAASVPGTVGGAVVNNAGAHGSDMSANLLAATVLERDGREVTYTLAELACGYRTSALKARADRSFVVLRASLRLMPDDPAVIQARIDEFIAYRKRTQPPGASLGSIFKNPPGDYAGRLIEAAGLKGWQLGGAQVSPVHGNFIVNTGGATAADYARLIEMVSEAVLAASGVRLELEIERVGEW